MLLEDIVDLEGIKYVHVGNMGPRVYRRGDRLRLYMDIDPEYFTRWGLLDPISRCHLQWSPTFMQSCSQIYHEADYKFFNGLCSSKEFQFLDSRALISWVKNPHSASKTRR